MQKLFLNFKILQRSNLFTLSLPLVCRGPLLTFDFHNNNLYQIFRKWTKLQFKNILVLIFIISVNEFLDIINVFHGKFDKLIHICLYKYHYPNRGRIQKWSILPLFAEICSKFIPSFNCHVVVRLYPYNGHVRNDYFKTSFHIFGSATALSLLLYLGRLKRKIF